MVYIMNLQQLKNVKYSRENIQELLNKANESREENNKYELYNEEYHIELNSNRYLTTDMYDFKNNYKEVGMCFDFPIEEAKLFVLVKSDTLELLSVIQEASYFNGRFFGVVS